MSNGEASALPGGRPASPVEGGRRFVELTVILAITQFKLRYYGNVLGYFWTLAKPLLLFGVLYVAFTEFVRFGGGIEHYAAYLITAIVLYTYFSETTVDCVTSLVDKEQLIRKIPMPLLAIPLSLSLDAAITLLLNLVAVLGFVAFTGVDITWRWLELPLIVGVLILLSTATGALLSNLYVFFRDTRPIWEVMAQLLFWATPVVYVIENVTNHTLLRVLMLNPLAVLMTQMRHAVIDPTAPSAAQAAGGYVWLLPPAAIVLGVLALSVVMHRRAAPRIAEQV
ncbi:MAG: ABC transporter permease [Actinomycetota bacterium]